MILIVDDDVKIMTLIEFALKSTGYQTITATDGERGLLLAREKKPDLILLDAIMPGMNGYTVCETLKHDQATRDIPVIMLTALDTGDDFEKALQKGADWYVTKPFDREHLLQKIAYLLEQKRGNPSC